MNVGRVRGGVIHFNSGGRDICDILGGSAQLSTHEIDRPENILTMVIATRGK